MVLTTSKKYVDLLMIEHDATKVFDVLKERAEKRRGLTADEVVFLCNLFTKKEESEEI